ADLVNRAGSDEMATPARKSGNQKSPEIDKPSGSDKVNESPRGERRESGSNAVGVRFLRTQQRVKSQCLYRPGHGAWSPRGPVLRIRVGDFFEASSLSGLHCWDFL
ncbi:hypothetical protein J4573_53450, partial [Actinomadura barringtoniae]